MIVTHAAATTSAAGNTYALTRVHRQRLAAAARASLSGHEVVFSSEPGEFCTQWVWYDFRRQRHVILSGFGRLAFLQLVAAARSEYATLVERAQAGDALEDV